MTTDAIRAQFSPAPGTVYLDAATYGLPPRATVEAMTAALAAWQSGQARWVEDWDRVGDRCRELFAALIGAAPDEIALVPTVSVGVAPIAASLRPGDEVLIPEDEFTSVLFPFRVAQETRGVRVRTVPYAALPDAIEDGTRLVAFSLVRSQDGRGLPLSAVYAAARAHGSRVLVDATHAIPFVPVASELADMDYLVCHGYKHLLCPRGAGFLCVRRDRWPDLPPLHANWRAAAPSYARSYGGEWSPAAGAARFDVSLAWLAWVGALPSLELLLEWQRAGHLAPVLDLAADLADRLGLPRPAASLVAVPVRDLPAALAALDAAGIHAAAPGGLVRLSPHVYNSPDEIDRAAEVMSPWVEYGR